MIVYSDVKECFKQIYIPCTRTFGKRASFEQSFIACIRTYGQCTVRDCLIGKGTAVKKEIKIVIQTDILVRLFCDLNQNNINNCTIYPVCVYHTYSWYYVLSNNSLFSNSLTKLCKKKHSSMLTMQSILVSTYLPVITVVHRPPDIAA